MARATIAQIREGSDFQKVYMWQWTVLRQPPLAPVDATKFDMQMMTTDVPKRTNDNATLMMRGYQIFDPGIYRAAGTIQMVFVETIDYFVREWLGTWEEVLYRKDGHFMDMSGDFRLTMMDNQENPVFSYDLLYCFLDDTNINTLDGGTSDPMQPQLTLRYIDFRRNPGG